MLFAMLLGSLNYGNNLGLGLTFLLAALASSRCMPVTATLEALIVRAASTEPPFAGGEAVFRIALGNPAARRAATSRRSRRAAPIRRPRSGRRRS